MRAVDAAFLLYEAFKEQQLPPDISTKILHDILFLRQLGLNKRMPIFA